MRSIYSDDRYIYSGLEDSTIGEIDEDNAEQMKSAKNYDWLPVIIHNNGFNLI
ncbi:MAG: hypothetical protein ACTSO2_05710 [Promethearchaeota archaeon]